MPSTSRSHVTDRCPSLSTFALVFEDEYEMSLTIASLNYLSLGIGFVLGLQICAPVNDRVRLPHPHPLPAR